MLKIPKKVNYDVLWKKPEYNWTTKKFLWFFEYTEKPKVEKDYDSFGRLVELGFCPEVDLYGSRFYTCLLPEGWRFEVKGCWTDFYNPEGVKVISCFDKWAGYDSTHFANFLI